MPRTGPRTAPAAPVATMVGLVALIAVVGLVALVRLLLVPSGAVTEGLPAVRIVHPEDGAVVSSPLTVVVAAEDVRLAPCTDPDPCGGHVTILVDRPCPATGEVVPSGSLRAAEAGVHGLTDGGTVLVLELPPGRHTLCAQLTDGLRVAFGQTHAVAVVVDREEALPWREVVLPGDGDRPGHRPDQAPTTISPGTR